MQHPHFSRPSFARSMCNAWISVLLLSLPVASACSSGDDTGGSKTGGNSNTGDGSNTKGNPSGNCSCSITYNGAHKDLACGSDTCLNGVSYSCGSGAQVTHGGSCTTTPDNGKDSGGEDTKGPFDCGGDTCDSATQYCILSTVRGSNGVSAYACVPFPSGCTSCDCASSNAESAWKAAENGTSNCTGVTILCNQSDSRITVNCQQ